MSFIDVVGVVLGSILLLYVAARVLSAAVFRSWWDAVARNQRSVNKNSKGGA